MKYISFVVLSCLFVFGVNSMGSIDENVLEDYSVKELYDFMQMDQYKQYHSVAAEVYGEKFGDIPIQGVNYKRRDFEFENDVIYFGKLETFTEFLRSFNRYIRNIKVDSLESVHEWGSTPDAVISAVLEAIDEHCGDTLTHFELREDHLNFVNNIKFTFPSVEELSLYKCAIYTATIDLKTTFPNVRRLKAEGTHFKDRNWVERNFQNLTNLKVTLGTPNGLTSFFTDFKVYNILREIRSISTLSLGNCETGMLEIINDQFPQIIDLEIINPKPEFSQKPIRLEHVKRFSCQGMEVQIEPFFEFDHLKILQWSSKSQFVHQLISLIQKHADQIEEIDILNTSISDNDLEEIGQLGKLQRFTVTFDPNAEEVSFDQVLSADALINFINGNKKLNEIHLIDVDTVLRKHFIEAMIQLNGFKWCKDLEYENDIHLVKGTQKKQGKTQNEPNEKSSETGSNKESKKTWREWLWNKRWL